MVMVVNRGRPLEWIKSVSTLLLLFWRFGGIECSPVVVVGTVQAQTELRGMLKGTLDHDDDDHNSLRTESKLGKRDLWEFVSASSDVIPIEAEKEKNFTSTFSSPSSSSSLRLYEPSSSSTDSRKVLSNSISSHQDVQMRLNKLEYYFGGLRIFEEDCRQRLICEISMDPAKFAPLSAAFLDETSYNGDEKMLSARLLTSNEGTRLLTYIEASQRGLNRDGCDIWAYRCPQTTETLINFQSLLTWREVLKWLTVKMVAKRH